MSEWPMVTPAPAADDSVPAELFSEPGFPDDDDPDDLPAAWSLPATAAAA